MEEFEKYLNKIFRYLSFRPRSEKEVRDFLKGKKVPEDISDKVLTYLFDHHYINDEEFTKWWIEQRTKFRAKGQRLIIMELKQKGISQEIIDRVFDNQETLLRQGFGGQAGIKSQAELAKTIVEKKLPKYKGLSKHEIYQKLGSALARRGFDWDTIKQSIDEVLRRGV